MRPSPPQTGLMRAALLVLLLWLVYQGANSATPAVSQDANALGPSVAYAENSAALAALGPSVTHAENAARRAARGLSVTHAGNAAAPAASAPGAGGALFLSELPAAVLNDQTGSISVAAGLDGAMHAAFVNLSADPAGSYHAYYDSCAPGLDCAAAANWTRVTLLSVPSADTIMDAAQLALDAQGRPRVLILTTDTGGSFQDHYQFAACDSGCAGSAGWALGDVLDLPANSTFIFQGNKHFFALDAQGRPRFIADNGSSYIYAACDAGCTSAAGWTGLSLNGVSGTGSGYNTAALAFDAAGKPRLLAPLVDQDTFQTNLYYWECSADDCATDTDSWLSTKVISPLSGGAALYSSLRLTRAGQPRFAWYGAPGGQDETLYYYWCSDECTTAASWSFSAIGLAPAADFNTSGQAPDLALDGQDRPRLSFQTLDKTLGSGLGLAWCDAVCESESAVWQKLLADSNAQLNSDWDRLGMPGCLYSSWVGGYRTTLALDADGGARIGHDAQHLNGLCGDPSLNGADYETVRFVYLPAGFAERGSQPPVR